MPTQIVDTILPTTMVGSYPRPRWFDYQLLGRDVRVAFKHADHAEAFNDATKAVIHDQEEAGLDIVCDGQMCFDDYIGMIGSFCWYWYERIEGFEPAKEEHPAALGAETISKEIALLSDWGGVINSGPVERGPIRLVDLYKIGNRYATKPLKVSVGAGPVNLAWHVYYEHYENPKELSYALAPIFNAEMKDLAAEGAEFLQFEDLGAWLPLFTGDDGDYVWIADVFNQCFDGVDAKIALHFCYGNAWGQPARRPLPRGLRGRPSSLLRPADRSVRARLRQPGDGRHRRAQVSPGGQGGWDRRHRHPHEHGRVARAGCRPRQEDHRDRPARARLPDDRLRDEGAAADRRHDEAEGAGRGRADRSGRDRMSGAALIGRGPA